MQRLIILLTLALTACGEPYLDYSPSQYDNSETCSTDTLSTYMRDVEIKAERFVKATDRQNNYLHYHFVNGDKQDTLSTLNTNMKEYALAKKDYEHSLVVLAHCY